MAQRLKHMKETGDEENCSNPHPEHPAVLAVWADRVRAVGAPPLHRHCRSRGRPAPRRRPRSARSVLFDRHNADIAAYLENSKLDLIQTLQTVLLTSSRKHVVQIDACPLQGMPIGFAEAD